MPRFPLLLLVAVAVLPRSTAAQKITATPRLQPVGRPTPDEPPDPRLDAIRRQVLRRLAGQQAVTDYDQARTELDRLNLYVKAYGPYQSKQDESSFLNPAKTHEVVAAAIKEALGLDCPDEPLDMAFMYLRAVQKKLSSRDPNDIWPESQFYAYAYSLVATTGALPWLYARIPDDAKAAWPTIVMYDRSKHIQRAMMTFLNDAIAARENWGATEDQLKGLLGPGYLPYNVQSPGSRNMRRMVVNGMLFPSGEKRFQDADEHTGRQLVYAAFLVLYARKCQVTAELP